MELSKLCQIVAITKVHPRSVQRAPMTVVFPGVVSFSSLPQAYPPRILQILAQRAHQIPVLLAARLASLVKSAWLCFCLREHCSCCHTLLHRPQACAFFAASCRSEEKADNSGFYGSYHSGHSGRQSSMDKSSILYSGYTCEKMRAPLRLKGRAALQCLC